MVMTALYAKQKKRHNCTERTLDSVGEARVGCSERIASKHVYYQVLNRLPVQVGCMRQVLKGWCIGKTQRDGMERETGGGIGMGNTWKSMTDSCQCMTKTTTVFKVISLQLIKINEKKKKEKKTQ